jgi:hypothetical protein
MQLVIFINLLIVNMSEIQLPGEAKQNNLPPEYGQPGVVGTDSCYTEEDLSVHVLTEQNRMKLEVYVWEKIIPLKNIELRAERQLGHY